VKRTALLLTIGFLFLLAGGYFGYEYFLKQRPIDAWDLIPEQTVLVYETGECAECFDQMRNSAPWSLYNEILFPEGQQDSLYRSFEFLRTPRKGELISLHITSRDNFDFAFHIPLNQLPEFSAVVEGWKKNTRLKFSERELNEIRISDIQVQGRVFSWTIVDNIWIGSFTPFLVEDAIRTYTDESKVRFRELVKDVYQLPRITKDAGNVFVHIPELMRWLSTFMETPSRALAFGKATLLDVKQSEGSITLNGFSVADKSEANAMLSLFEGQAPVTFQCKQYISDRTLFSATYGVSDGRVWYEKLPIAKDKRISDTLTTLVPADLAKLYAGLGPEISVNYLEGRGDHLSSVLIFQASNTADWLSFFDKLSKATEHEDTVFYEEYASYPIREIEMVRLPEKLFAPIVKGFDRTYYSSLGNTIIIAERLEELRSFLNDINNEEVWGKSVAFNKFLESGLLESNISYYINTPLLWNYLSGKLRPNWKKFVQENRSSVQALEMGAVQFSYLNETFYTNVNWKYGRIGATGSVSASSPQRVITNLDASVIAGPFVIRNHASKQDEAIVQDSLYNVYQIDAEGKILWKVNVGGKIVGAVDQVDLFRNGKLQAFFAADKKLHVIDRLGRYVAPYPVNVGVKDLEYTAVVDYDQSRKYRYLLTERSGKLWMYDKEGSNLDGWKPFNAESQLISPASHYRVRGKDFIIGIRKDGWAHVITRRGEHVKGFPLNLDARPEGDYFVEPGNSLATSYVICVSRDGFRVKFNLEGKIISKETLIKPTIETRFSLVKSEQGKSYLIRRQDSRKLALLNDDLQEIVVNEFVGTNPLQIRYYNFGSGRQFITITDMTQELSYLYDGQGLLLTQMPMESMGVSVASRGNNEFLQFVAHGNTFTVLPIGH
jgi:hypothetical protein